MKYIFHYITVVSRSVFRIQLLIKTTVCIYIYIIYMDVINLATTIENNTILFSTHLEVNILFFLNIF